MNTTRGFAAVTALLIVLGIVVIGGAGYVALNPEVLKAPAASDDGVQTEPGDHPEEEQPASGNGISWKIESAGEIEATPYTKVSVTVDGKTYDMGSFAGSCSQVGASGGVDGKGLLAGELSAVQCWFAGGGDEIGVFAHEDGGYQIMVGGLSEPDGESSQGFRGDFSIKYDIAP